MDNAQQPQPSPEPPELALPQDSQSTDEPESLFERYEPRSVSTILAQHHARQESPAAEAAAIILDGAEPIELSDTASQTTISTETDHSPSAHHRETNLTPHQFEVRVYKIHGLALLFTPGAQFVYALIMITALGGLMGLAATMHSPALVLVVGIASPIILPICIWKWIRWLDSTPYYYRLLTSLGEDARNLLNYRLFWKRSHPKA